MKKLNFILLFIAAHIFLFAQDKSAAYNATQIVWCGLDFSMAKCVGSEGFTDPTAIKNDYFQKWNEVMLSEPDKYDFKKFFYKDDVLYQIDMVEANNKKPNAADLVTNNSYTFDADKVQTVIANYKSDKKEGVGLVFVVESLDKTKESAFVYVTFFDLKDNKVLVTNRVEGKAGGFGFRNYWLGAFYNVMKASQKQYKKWFK